MTNDATPRESSRRPRRISAIVAIVAVLVTGSVVGQPSAPPASAADYPSWQDVLASRANESAKKTEIARLEALLKQLEAEVVATQAAAEEKGAIYFEAQLAYDEAAFKADRLQAQANEAQAAADVSLRQAGQIAARSQRVGGADLTATLFFSESGAGDLLTQLGMASKVSQQSTGIYTKAKQDQNTAQSLTDQANVAKSALAALAAVAQQAMLEAQAAADAAAAALEEQSANQARLQAQLASLVENRIATEAEYVVGIQALWGAGAGLGAGQISASGWARPSGGYISSGYGYRVPPKNGASSLHAGVDFGAGCGTPIFAAHGGTVEYAGPLGGYGNYIRINHGDGTSSAYGHIVDGGILVSTGQGIGPGQNIARVGTTGTSTGCHLHFEIRVGGSTVDPVPFLRNQGVSV